MRRSRGFDAGQWVEFTDDAQERRGDHGSLVKIVKVESDTLTIEPSQNSDTSHATKVRRWDQILVGDVELVDGAVKVAASTRIDLEDGVQVQFEFAPDSTYRTGDYWLIPARVATGKIEWPEETNGDPQWRSPHGIQHHYAPLATLQDGKLISSCRCGFAQASCP